MTIAERIIWILADGTPEQKVWEELVGKPSSSLVPTNPTVSEDSAVIDEYISGIVLDEPVSTFQHRLSVYGDKPISTFSVLA